MNILNVGIVFFNAQMLFANFITNVLHESADLNYRTAIWQIVMAKIAESPVIGHGLNMGNVSFAIGQGIAGINQATHNGILYFVFSSGIIGTVYILGICFLLLRKTNQRTRILKHTKTVSEEICRKEIMRFFPILQILI